MNVTDRLKSLDFKGRDFPILKGDVKMTLKNVHNGKTEVFEKHNLVTNALSDIFGNNYGGLVNYNSFADLYKTYLGGVLVFASALDSDPTKYGIPAYTTNPVTAHAGQTHLTSQNDDTTRGNPDDSATVLTSGSTKMVWEWGTNAGNGQISSLGLTHSDVGSFGCGSRSDGANPTCLQSLNPFADVGCNSMSFPYGDNSNAILAINNNVAYTLALTGDTTVKVYKTPINCTKFKLQGGSLAPITDYTESITVTLAESYGRSYNGDLYYWFDFDNDLLYLFGIPTQGGRVVYVDTVDLSNFANQTATHREITFADATVKLWKFYLWQQYVESLYDYRPTKAMVFNNRLYVYGYTDSAYTPNKIHWVDLTNDANQGSVDVTHFSQFGYRSNIDGYHRIGERFTNMGEIIAHRSFLINGDKTFQISDGVIQATKMDLLPIDGISSPHVGLVDAVNSISVCKLYLATKWNLDSPVTKNASQSMTVEYTLTEV